jgi:outer membrane protein assembly factor BamE (lipoprotein component of BamABCDE complex)
MKTILLFVIILFITGCYLVEPRDPGTSTILTKKQVKYMWSQVFKDMSKEEVTRILGDPTDTQSSGDVDSWKYEYDIARTYGIVGFHRSDNLVRFFSKPLF